MLSLFTGKISGVLSLALQGISQVNGLVLNTVLDVVDTVVDSINTTALTELPVVGSGIRKVLELESNLVSSIGGGLRDVADHLASGNLLGAVDTALEGVTLVVGQTLSDATAVVEQVVGLTSPVTELVSDVLVIGDILSAAGDTTNLLGLIDETADYVAGIDPLALLENTLNDPLGTIGGTLQDVSGTLDHLLEDLLPVTEIATSLYR